MPESNRRFLLSQRPDGRITADTFELVEEAVPEIADGEALVRTRWISLDPTNRAWINETPTYLPPVAIGEVMRAVGLGQVVASKHDGYEEGQLVQGLTGWQDWTVASDSAPLLPVPEVPGVSPSAYLGVLGATGLTAWVGLTDIGRPQPGETVVVSAAAGPRDPRLYARLATAAHLARLLAEPPKEADAKRLSASVNRDLAELQLLQGPGTLLVVAWEDLGADLVARAGGKGDAVAGETIDAAAVGISALLLPAGKPSPVQAHLRSAQQGKPLKLTAYTIKYDGKVFTVGAKHMELPVGQTDLTL